jgi:hypothetical protein
MIVVQTSPGYEINGKRIVRTYLSIGDCDSLSRIEVGWAVWFAADFGDLFLDQVRFTRCDLSSSDFSRCTLKDVTFIECTLIGARFPTGEQSNWECIDCHDSLKTISPWDVQAKREWPI